MDLRRNLRLAAKSDHTWPHQHTPTSRPIPDHVLLCCFGPELLDHRRAQSVGRGSWWRASDGALTTRISRDVGPHSALSSRRLGDSGVTRGKSRA
jgi:hypothetical protein